ncbi:hypothetical protein [uncultured Methylobacterium sp.]|uniref:hypothetical protein n=1 Tax=uncultured Methylobacterium sp. TaxID=157278 RepID=UPI0035CB79C0
MSSVINSLAASYATQKSGTSPKDRVMQSITDEVASGKIGAADGTALTQAFGSITESLRSERSTSGDTGAATRTTRLDPAQLKEKVDSLIDEQVEGGSLTVDQAEELKAILSQNAPQAASAGDASTTQAASAAETSTADDLLAGFIKSLQEVQDSAGAGYGSTGSSSKSQASSALLLDFQA